MPFNWDALSLSWVTFWGPEAFLGWYSRWLVLLCDNFWFRILIFSSSSLLLAQFSFLHSIGADFVDYFGSFSIPSPVPSSVFWEWILVSLEFTCWFWNGTYPGQAFLIKNLKSKCSKLWKFLSGDFMPQMENDTPWKFVPCAKLLKYGTKLQSGYVDKACKKHKRISFIFGSHSQDISLYICKSLYSKVWEIWNPKYFWSWAFQIRATQPVTSYFS